jgi:aryl-alcohol dehydrogenase-like predicted oxidoreductase
LQIEYSLIERTVERELIPMARAFDVSVVAWSPLASGLLSGKYQSGAGKAEGRLSAEGMEQFLPERQRADRILAAVKSVAAEVGRSMAQVALAWLRYQAVPVIPIIGARKLAQLEDNLASLDLQLTAAQLQSLDAASRVELGFPQEFYTKELVRTLRYGGVADRLVR